MKWIDTMINAASSGSLSADEVKALIAAELLKDPEVLDIADDVKALIAVDMLKDPDVVHLLRKHYPIYE